MPKRYHAPLPEQPDQDSPVRNAWRPSPFLQGSLWLHTGALAAMLLAPSSWPWAAGAVAANQAVITLAGMWPRSRLLGPNWTRLPPASAARGEVAITIDDGPDPDVTPRVLELLERHGTRASFFCIGEVARRHPGLCRKIVARGHDIENHSLHHRLDFAFAGYRGFLRELSEAQRALAEVSGSRPVFFRAPFGIRNPLLDPVLSRLELQLASWTRRGYDTREPDPDKVLGRLLKNLDAGDILLLHDGHAARTGAGQAVILAVLPRLLEALQEANLRPVTLRSARS